MQANPILHQNWLVISKTHQACCDQKATTALINEQTEWSAKTPDTEMEMWLRNKLGMNND